MSTTTRPAGALRVRRGGRAVAALLLALVWSIAAFAQDRMRTPALAPLGR